LTGCLFFLRKVTFEKQWFYLDNAIGHSYGSAFDVSSGGSLQLRKKLEEPASGTRQG
jgi:tRNA (adenine-N(1)-)-methyltransferase non-catalytic subunit